MNNHIVFDLDWTIADTQKIHEQIESDFLSKKGVFIEPKLIGATYAWRTPQEWMAEVLSSNNAEFDKDELEDFVASKDSIVIALLKEWKIELMPHAFEILELLHKNDYKIAISSGACREFIDEFIRYFKFEDIIIASTSSNEVEFKKPNPDVFLASFKKIEDIFWTPDIKYVVWDWWSDVEWWHRSLARTIWLNYWKKDRLNDIYCNFEIQSLLELTSIFNIDNI
jgi:beta-phosphoglucomutase-like phosphatase (HAD superfamily)